MSQAIYSTINPATTSGNQLAAILDDLKEALVSGMSGVSRPTELDAGGFWVDIAADPIWYFKLWTGTADIIVFSISTATGLASIAGAESPFTLTQISADTTSPILTLLKKRIINNGQVLLGDYVGTIQFKGNADDLSVPITCRVRGIATNNYTATTAGTDLIFEATSVGTLTLIEMMRLKDGKLGVGTPGPTHTIHALGTGIKNERAVDDALGATWISRKRKATGTGQTNSADVVALHEFKSTDELSAEVDVAKMEVVATETHTSTALGTRISFWLKKIGSLTLTEMLRLGDSILAKEDMGFEKTLALLQQVDSATTGAAQSLTPTKSLLKVTNASLTSINNISAPTDGKIIALINGTGASVTITNDSGGTAANRIKTGSGADLTWTNNTSLLLAYDANASRWQIVGGSGGAGGGALTTTGTVGAPNNIVAGTGIAYVPGVFSRQVWFVATAVGEVDVTVNPQIAAATTLGYELWVYGTSNDNYIILQDGTGLSLKGDWYSYANSILKLMWNGSVWAETGRV